MSSRQGAAQAGLQPGDLLEGKYRLVRCLGQGGMGEVWEAEHAKLGRRVAMKFIHSEVAQDQGILQRFQNEARAAAKLQSRFIVQVLDDGVTEGGLPFIVMEKLVGESLGDRLERVGQLSVDETRRVLRDVCRGLAIAHEAGIVHRDLKPDNIFLHRGHDDDHETAKLVDFGIAKFIEGTGDGHSTTQTGSMLGTPLYMSPEQARGAKPIDQRSDVWSVGIVVYQCLTGAVPFHGSTIGDIAIRICMSEHAPPSSLRDELPPQIDGWMAKALAKAKDNRFSSAAEMLDAFERALAGEEVGPTMSMRAASAASLDISGDETLGAPVQARRAMAPVPRVRSSSDSEPPSVASASGRERPERGATLGAVSTRGGAAAKGPSKVTLFAAGLLVTAAVGTTALFLARRGDDHPAITPLPSAASAASALVAPPPSTPAPALSAAPVEPVPSAAVAPAQPAPASSPSAAPGPRPARPPPGKPGGRRKGGDDSDLGY